MYLQSFCSYELTEVCIYRLNHRGNTALVTEEYARRFHASLVQARPPSSSYPTDLYVPFTGFNEATTTALASHY
eukprot:6485076-Amphidinium_carterae.2